MIPKVLGALIQSGLFQSGILFYNSCVCIMLLLYLVEVELLTVLYAVV